MSDFDSLSRGDQFLRLLKIEYEDLLKEAKRMYSFVLHSREIYIHTDEEKAQLAVDMEFYSNTVKYYDQALRGLKGAENEDLVLTGARPESSDQFAGIGCTTVL